MVKFIHVDNQNDAVPDPDTEIGGRGDPEIGGRGGGKNKGLPRVPGPSPGSPNATYYD